MSEKNRLKLIKLRKQAIEDDKTMTSEKFREKYFSDLESLLGAIDDQIDKELSKAGADKGIPSEEPFIPFRDAPRKLRIQSLMNRIKGKKA